MRVGLAVEMNGGYYRSALQGIATYARERKGWFLDHHAPTPPGISALMQSSPDGIIMAAGDPAILESVAKSGVPTVSIGVVKDAPPLAHVGNDDAAIGEMGAIYFLQKGYRHFGFAARTRERIDQRSEGFVRVLEREGIRCSCLVYSGDGVEQRREMMRKWLRELGKPAAVLCSNDHLAWALTVQCARLGIEVPSQISVLGVDNDVTVCALSEPTLSSIQTGAESVGYEAARLLEQHVLSPLREPIHVRVAPIRVVERCSTDAFAVTDDVVTKALQFMREHLKSPLSMDAFAKRFGCSRRKLERLFHDVLGQAPAQAWMTLRTNEARRLLAETDLSIEDISYVVGFNQASQLSNALRKQIGMTPSAFRRRARP